MSRELLVWGSLLSSCVCSALVGGIVDNPLIMWPCYAFIAVVNFLILFHGSKRCSAIGVNNHCYTILFLTMCIFGGLFILAVLICVLLAMYWLWIHDWSWANNYPSHGWLTGFAIGTISTFTCAVIIILWKNTKMCPGWSDEHYSHHDSDYDETDCEFADAEEIEDLPAK